MTNGLVSGAENPWDIVRESKDGSAVRRDGKELKSRRTNPWYVLATLHGEQDADAFDKDLAEKNREAWNLWAGRVLTKEARAEIAKRLSLPEAELGGDIDHDTNEDWEFLSRDIRRRFHDRLGKGVALPEPTQEIDFSSTYFPKSTRLDFSKYVFNGDFLLYGSTINSHTNFTSTAFVHHSSFDSAIFAGSVSFNSAIFTEEASFDSTRFPVGATFYSTDFDSDASFSNARFAGRSAFNLATFNKGAEFDSVTFTNVPIFSNVTFVGDAIFEAARFHDKARFFFSTFTGRASFAHSIIEREIQFRDCLFETPANFRRSEFRTQLPTFEGTILHDATYFTAGREYWPAAPENNPDEGKEAAATIRHVVAKQSRADDAHFFFRKEMEFVLKDGGPKGWLVWVYKVLSNYGDAVLKPAMGLFLSWLLPFLFYASIFGGSCWRNDILAPACRPRQLEALTDAAGFSFSNLFTFFGLHRVHFADFLKDQSDWMHFIAGLQTVLGFVFLFFFGLGLRNRFRLR